MGKIAVSLGLISCGHDAAALPPVRAASPSNVAEPCPCHPARLWPRTCSKWSVLVWSRGFAALRCRGGNPPGRARAPRRRRCHGHGSAAALRLRGRGARPAASGCPSDTARHRPGPAVPHTGLGTGQIPLLLGPGSVRARHRPGPAVPHTGLGTGPIPLLLGPGSASARVRLPLRHGLAPARARCASDRARHRPDPAAPWTGLGIGPGPAAPQTRLGTGPGTLCLTQGSAPARARSASDRARHRPGPAAPRTGLGTGPAPLCLRQGSVRVRHRPGPDLPQTGLGEGSAPARPRRSPPGAGEGEAVPASPRRCGTLKLGSCTTKR
uniref:uncharacterized protein n=1 Tax=Lonchura striata TaxID=40157 RepID=UPI001293404C|nr:uncharacterized protein LOC116184175 [Lonchura striata domestica]